jgi:hypothetical protein
VIDAVRLALTAVRTRDVPESGELTVVELQGAPGVLLGVDHLRRPHMLLGLSELGATELTRDISALQLGVRTLSVGGETHSFLDVTCLFQSVADVFEHFVAAVADRVNARLGDAPNALTEVLEKWKQFLIPAETPIGRGKLAATLGELLVLRDIVRADPSRRVDSWVGPSGARHDFRRGSVALEVKTTRAHTSHEVTIHGEDQLERPEDGFLYLHFVRLEEVPSGGETVQSLIDDLLSSGATADRLFEALTAAGIPVAELAATSDTSFQVRERLTLPIDDEAARIVPSSFVGGARPSGVVDLSYVISLDHFIDRSLTDSDYRQLIVHFAEAA